MKLALAAVILVASGCHYYVEDDDDGSAAADGGAGPIADAAPGPDGGACDPIALLPEAYRPVGSVSSGEVATEVESAAQQIFVTTVDASAGGAEGQAQQPYVYLRFTCDDGPVKVEIDDLAALESTEWDL